MELVYLWVEDYKNIKKQGFNFSPRFKCELKDEYDEKGKLKDNCELIIDKNEDYVSIFPENINITAIVGENGSGKSNLIKCIDFVFTSCQYNIYFSNNILYSDFPLKQIINKTNYELKEKEEHNEIIFLNRNFFMEVPLNGALSPLFLDNKNLYSKYFKLDKKNSTININNFHKEILRTLLFSKSNIKNTFFNPKKIRIKFNQLHKDFIESKKIREIRIYNNLYNYKEIYKIYLKSNDLISSQNKGIDVESEMIDFLNDKDKILNFNIYDESFILKGDDDIFKFLEKFIVNNPSLLFSKDFIFRELKRIEFLKDNNFEIFLYLNKIGFLEYDFIDEQKTFSSLSSGEKSFFSEFLFLNKEIFYNRENKTFLLIFDEPETTLHPQWQKKYINEVVTFLKNYTTKDIQFHVLITSHSPFILSDLPKKNIIFLEKGKQVYPFEDNQQTFGANIHTLLSHGFFMKDGLMGEFAKDKIDIAIKYLNQTKLSDDEISYCENIISIIGEPIIKRELQRKLDSKRLSKLDKIDEIEEQMRLLEHRLEMIRKNQK
ncbi:ATP-binding protein [Arcobacter sp. F2176]|uniref:ATP-binding protein n=1 Tax=Arcobacter sp. F2176 TaxID=2044511 RepID=UPI00100BAE90|nr:ATP-binding protein [Arcobacter sp. F2176]RXJ82229.1 hypothetical protein CRU95_01875 [Arcobacter sp. F2176]